MTITKKIEINFILDLLKLNMSLYKKCSIKSIKAFNRNYTNYYYVDGISLLLIYLFLQPPRCCYNGNVFKRSAALVKGTATKL